MAWASLLAMQIVSFAISLDVMRAMSYAQLLALPGNAVLMASLLAGAQRLRVMPLRVLLSVGTVIMTPFGAAAAMAAALDPANAVARPEGTVARFQMHHARHAARTRRANRRLCCSRRSTSARTCSPIRITASSPPGITAMHRA